MTRPVFEAIHNMSHPNIRASHKLMSTRYILLTLHCGQNKFEILSIRFFPQSNGNIYILTIILRRLPDNTFHDSELVFTTDKGNQLKSTLISELSKLLGTYLTPHLIILSQMAWWSV